METTPHTDTKFSHPLATLAVTFVLGILSVEFLSAKTYIFVFAGPIAGVLCLFSVVRGSLGAAAVFIAFAFVMAGGALASIEKYVPRNSLKAMLDSGVIAEGDSL